MSKKQKIMLVSIFVLLLLGVANYTLFRPDILLFYRFSFTPHHYFTHLHFVRLFLTGYFSDITWCAALCLSVVLLKELQSLPPAGRMVMLSLPFLTEVAQYFHLLQGTFDWYDILLYAIVILLFGLLFSILTLADMKKIKSSFFSYATFILFFAMAIASVAPRTTYQNKPLPCVTHKPLYYSPILVQVNLSGSYTMKDLQGAQRTGQTYIIDELNVLNAYKYKLADGVTPNLNLYITVNTDNYEHYGASVTGYVFDGNFNFTLPASYVTSEKLFEDIAEKINSYIVGGWCNNCPSPCTP